jgi:hypothetical protein
MHPVELKSILVNPPKIILDTSRSQKMAIATVELPVKNEWWWGTADPEDHVFRVFLTFQRNAAGLFTVCHRHRTNRVSKEEEFFSLTEAVDRVNELLLPYIL